MTPFRVLVLGGYGNFGTRICRALANEPSIAVIIAGRDGERASALARQIGGTTHGVALDIQSGGLSREIKRLGAQLVIHTAGPFQGQNYRVAEAVALAKAHYIDLADGRRFVCDFQKAMQNAFLKAERTAVAGASTVPALSSAVIDALCRNWHSINAIDICIAPAQQAPRGSATLTAVLSYCGKQIPVWKEGRWQSLIGWSAPEEVQFASMKTRKGALCDIPDLEIFPERYRVSERVMFRAAIEVRVAQWVFSVLASMRAKGYIFPPERFASVFNIAASALDFMGSGLGGMVVRAGGYDELNRPVQDEWHISADDNHGPEIPCMAAVLLARQLAKGHEFTPGARPCMDLLSLADFEPEFSKWGMRTQIIRTVRG